MRSLLPLFVLGIAASGCVSHEQYLAKSREVELLRKLQDAQGAELQALTSRLAELEESVSELEARRGEARARIDRLEDDLIRSLQAREDLQDLQEQLVARQKEIQRLNEKLSSVWYNSALGRARRAADPQEDPVHD